MKTLIVLAFIALSGCATPSTFVMQPDGSYQITSKKQSFASPDEKKTAYSMAARLCPAGFTTESEFESNWREYLMVVKCDTIPRAPATEDQVDLPDKIENVKDPVIKYRLEHPERFRRTDN